MAIESLESLWDRRRSRSTRGNARLADGDFTAAISLYTRAIDLCESDTERAMLFVKPMHASNMHTTRYNRARKLRE